MMHKTSMLVRLDALVLTPKVAFLGSGHGDLTWGGTHPHGNGGEG